jgi:hypothetical protein
LAKIYRALEDNLLISYWVLCLPPSEKREGWGSQLLGDMQKVRAKSGPAPSGNSSHSREARPQESFSRAAAFAGAHAYQGWLMALPIGLLGMIAGTIAYWCKSVRPGMIEHFLQDILGGSMGH